jgi:hypothetical protein
MVLNVLRTASTATVFGALLISGAATGGCAFPSMKVSEDRVVTAPLGAERFVLKGDVGDVTLVSSDTVSEITAAVHVVGKGTTQAKAQEVLDHLEIVFRYDADRPGLLIAGVELPRMYSKNPYGAEVDWEIVMPSGVSIDLSTDVGDVDATGFVLGARASADVGDITLTDCRGDVDAHTDVGDIRVSTDGAINAKSDVGDVRITLLGGNAGDLIASTDVGDVVVDIPVDRVGHVHASTDIGRVSSSFDGMDAEIHKNKKGTLIADLGGKSDPKIDLRTDVGSVRVKTRGGAE